ncbi:hypothetical protein ACS0TY_001927 [Phlomoides rotata]
MHAYFDGFVHSRSTLKQFVEQYDIAIGNKIQKEFQADFQSKNKVIKSNTSFTWEKQFQKAYTNSIFSLVQDQIKRMLNLRILLSGGHLEHTSVVIAENLSLRVEKGCVYRRHSSIFFAGGYPHMTEEYKNFQEVEKYFQQCANAAMGSIEKMEYIKEMCIDMKNELINWNSGSTTTNVDHSVRTSQSLGGTPVLDPNVAVPRGRPRTTRFMSASEARGRGRGGRCTSDATRTSGKSGRGGRRASGATLGTRGCTSRGRSRVASMPTHGDNNNDNEFLFDLNEDLNASQASFVF